MKTLTVFLVVSAILSSAAFAYASADHHRLSVTSITSEARMLTRSERAQLVAILSRSREIAADPSSSPEPSVSESTTSTSIILKAKCIERRSLDSSIALQVASTSSKTGCIVLVTPARKSSTESGQTFVVTGAEPASGKPSLRQ